MGMKQLVKAKKIIDKEKENQYRLLAGYQYIKKNNQEGGTPGGRSQLRRTTETKKGSTPYELSRREIRRRVKVRCTKLRTVNTRLYRSRRKEEFDGQKRESLLFQGIIYLL